MFFFGFVFCSTREQQLANRDPPVPVDSMLGSVGS